MAKSKYNYAQGEGVGFVPVKCPICGKMYIPAPEHVYRNYNGKRLVCSYTCSIISRKAHPDYRKRIYHSEWR